MGSSPATPSETSDGLVTLANGGRVFGFYSATHDAVFGGLPPFTYRLATRDEADTFVALADVLSQLTPVAG